MPVEPRFGLTEHHSTAQSWGFIGVLSLQAAPKIYPTVPPAKRRPIRVLSLFDGIATGEALEEHCPGGLQHWMSGLNSLLASNLSLKAWWGEGDEGQGDPPQKGMRAGAPLPAGRGCGGRRGGEVEGGHAAPSAILDGWFH